MSRTLNVVQDLNVELQRDLFLRTLLRHLSGVLQDVVGLEEASGFVSVVGQRLGDGMNDAYRAAWGTAVLSREQVTDVLVDLKRRIQGDFYVISADDERIVLGNRRCPFGDKVVGRPALCMMTSNVFGRIAAENLGYAKVAIEEAISRGHPGCRVVIHLHSDAPETPSAPAREYFRA